MSIYLTVILFAACLPRFELYLGPSLAPTTIQVFYINKGADTAL